MMSFAAIDSENVQIKNLSVDFAVPTVVDLFVEEVNGDKVTYRIPEETFYRIDGHNLIWESDRSSYNNQVYWRGQSG